MELLLIRHALPVRRELAAGPADPDLSVDGLAQAVHLAGYLAVEQLHAIYSSPLSRALQTAEPLSHRQTVPILVDDGLAEYDRHATEYVPIEELKRDDDARYRAVLAGDRGTRDQSPEEFQAVVIEAIERIVDAHPSQKVALVCHGGVINAYLAHVLGGGPDPAGFFYPSYTSIHRVIAARSGQRTLVTINETAHLRGTGLPIGLHQ